MKDLPSTELLSVLEQHLSSGTDETLLTAHFSQQLTAIFNGVAGEDAADFRVSHDLWLLVNFCFDHHNCCLIVKGFYSVLLSSALCCTVYGITLYLHDFS